MTAALMTAVSVRPTGGPLAALTVWAGVHLVFGGLSVLPLPGLPFDPEQAVSHYAAHVVYAADHLPLLCLAWSLLHARL